jgi:hypothetical protein
MQALSSPFSALSSRLKITFCVSAPEAKLCRPHLFAKGVGGAKSAHPSHPQGPSAEQDQERVIKVYVRQKASVNSLALAW